MIRRSGLGSLELAVFTRRLADLMNGGLTLPRSLEALFRQSGSRALRVVIQSLKNELEAGRSFSDALSNQTTVFPPLYIGMVRAGESAGSLEPALEDLARLLDAEREARQKITAAAAYPAILLLLCIAVSVFLVTFVIPRFQFLFDDLGQRLPLPTRMLISAAVLIRTRGWLIAVLLAAMATLLWKLWMQWRGSARRLLFRWPGVGRWIGDVWLHRWSRLMAALLKSGFTVVEAIGICQKSENNSLMLKEMSELSKKISQGESLAAAMECSFLFPPSICELVAAGEESGNLDEALSRISSSCEREVATRLKVALSLLEPALVVGMGVVVGFVALAMVLPIFEMSASLK